MADFEAIRAESRKRLEREKAEHANEYEPDPSQKHTCLECVRFMEGSSEQYHCSAVFGPDRIEPHRKACGWYWDRAEKMRMDREVEAERKRVRNEAWIRNRNKPPVDANWYEEYGSHEMPHCPECDNPVLELVDGRCWCCGQRINEDERLKEWMNPPEVECMDCFICGGKDTVQFTRSRVNGHRHGFCAKCGMKFIE